MGKFELGSANESHRNLSRTSQRPLRARSGRSEHARGESPNDQSGL